MRLGTGVIGFLEVSEEMRFQQQGEALPEPELGLDPELQALLRTLRFVPGFGGEGRFPGIRPPGEVGAGADLGPALEVLPRERGKGLEEPEPRPRLPEGPAGVIGIFQDGLGVGPERTPVDRDHQLVPGAVGQGNRLFRGRKACRQAKA